MHNQPAAADDAARSLCLPFVEHSEGFARGVSGRAAIRENDAHQFGAKIVRAANQVDSASLTDSAAETDRISVAAMGRPNGERASGVVSVRAKFDVTNHQNQPAQHTHTQFDKQYDAARPASIR